MVGPAADPEEPHVPLGFLQDPFGHLHELLGRFPPVEDAARGDQEGVRIEAQRLLDRAFRVEIERGVARQIVDESVHGAQLFRFEAVVALDGGGDRLASGDDGVRPVEDEPELAVERREQLGEFVDESENGCIAAPVRKKPAAGGGI